MDQIVERWWREQPEHVRFQNDEARGVVLPSRRSNEYAWLSFSLRDKRQGPIEISCQTKIRYPLDSVRSRKYLEALSERLDPLGFSLDIGAPRTIRVSTEVDSSLLLEEDDVQDSEFNGIVVATAHLSDQIATCARLSYRLSGQNGTDRYQKLSPPRLAMLTVCHFDGMPLN